MNGRTWASMKERFRKVGANVRNIAYTLLLLYTTTYLEFFDYEISEEKKSMNMMINMVLNHISNVFPLINAVVIFTGYIEEPGRVWINRGGKGQIQANTIKKGTPA